MGQSDEGVMDDYITADGTAVTGILTSQERDKKVSAQKQFRRPGPFTVQFSLKIPQDIGAIVVEAEVTWSVNGNQIVRRVAVDQGMTISGNAESVAVSVVDATDPLSLFPNRDYQVTITIAPGTRPAGAMPPRYTIPEYRVEVAAGATAQFLIPDDIGAVAINTTVGDGNGPGFTVPIPDQAVQVGQFDTSVNIMSLYDPRQFMWTPILQGCRLIRYFNGHVNAVIFSSVLAIDG